MYCVYGAKSARVLWSVIAEMWRTLVEWCFWEMEADGSDVRKANTEAALVSRTRWIRRANARVSCVSGAVVKRSYRTRCCGSGRRAQLVVYYIGKKFKSWNMCISLEPLVPWS
jgi:hypothetical protein